MPACPNCEKEITYLLTNKTGTAQVSVYIDTKGQYASLVEDFEDDLCTRDEYVCPECGEFVVNDEIDAEDFLKGTWVKAQELARKDKEAIAAETEITEEEMPIIRQVQ